MATLDRLSRSYPFDRGGRLYRSFIFLPVADLNRLSRSWPFDTGPGFNGPFKFQPVAALDGLSRNWPFFIISVGTTLRLQSAR